MSTRLNKRGTIVVHIAFQSRTVYLMSECISYRDVVSKVTEKCVISFALRKIFQIRRFIYAQMVNLKFIDVPRLFTTLLLFVYPVQSLLNLVFVCLERTKHFYSKYLLYEIKERILWPNPIESRWYPYYILKFVHIRHIYIYILRYFISCLYPKYRGLLGKKSIICIFR